MGPQNQGESKKAAGERVCEFDRPGVANFPVVAADILSFLPDTALEDTTGNSCPQGPPFQSRGVADGIIPVFGIFINIDPS